MAGTKPGHDGAGEVRTCRPPFSESNLSEPGAYLHTLAGLDLACAVPLGDPKFQGVNVIMGPLQGIKVIDMTTVLMGPYATQMLGDYGADIIKVESLDGDVTRLIGPTRNPGMGPVFLNTNRSKRSICLDLKKPGGRDVVLRLIRSADA